MNSKTPRGTHDLFYEEVLKFQKIESIVREVAEKYTFTEIRTPIFEYASVFEKNIGNETDIVNKEMYIFEDRNSEKFALRPEGTAPVVRAVISNSLTHDLPLKFYYLGPMFRYERPQKGRQRQFHQLGFEYLGTLSPASDVETINLAVDILDKLGISNYKVLINSLGDNKTLMLYKEHLLKYLYSQKHLLSEDSLLRLERNPLRILDSKSEKDQEIVASAPKISEFYTDSDKQFFNSVLAGLDKIGIKYEVSSSLVRGLDYYNHTVFEMVTTQLGAQGALIAGGRYNNLIKDMGGPNAGCFGFAGGIERLALMLEDVVVTEKALALISLQEDCDAYLLQLGNEIRKNLNMAASFILGKDVSTKLKKLDKNKFSYAIIVGENEVKTNTVTIKNLTTFEQLVVSYSEIFSFFTSKGN